MIRIASKHYGCSLFNSHQIMFRIWHKRPRTPKTAIKIKKQGIQLQHKDSAMFPYQHQQTQAAHIQNHHQIQLIAAFRPNDSQSKLGIHPLYGEQALSESNSENPYSIQWHNNHSPQSTQMQQEDDSQARIQQYIQNYGLNKRINKFDRNVDVSVKIQNAGRLAENLVCLLPERDYQELIKCCEKYIKEIFRLEKSKVTPKEKSFFQSIKKLLHRYIEDEECVNELLVLFSRTDPAFAQVELCKKVRELPHCQSNRLADQSGKSELTHTYSAYLEKNFSQQIKKSLGKLDHDFNESKTHQFNAHLTESHELKALGSPEVKASRSHELKALGSPEVKAQGSPEVKASRSPEVKAQGSPEVKASRSPEVKASRSPELKTRNIEILEIIQSLEQEEMKAKKRIKSIKLYVKKEKITNQLQADEQNIQKMEKKIFGNKKLITQPITFKRIGNRTNDKMNGFGDNWVYCFDLPYDFSAEDAQLLVSQIQKRYGRISEYLLYPYKNVVEKSGKQEIVYIMPDNFNEESKWDRRKIEKVKCLSESGSDYFIHPRTTEKKSLTAKILEKTKKQKQLKLNKSSMLLKFGNKKDKNKFLTPDMRLMGLNLGLLRNIKFEDAHSKNMVALTMVPWGCESQELIKSINDTLLPLKITLTHPNCIIAKSYIFLEMANFYEAFYAKDLLNQQIFQNQRLKCQIIYGPCRIRQGSYRNDIQDNHYQNLAQKLSNLRNFYSQFYS